MVRRLGQWMDLGTPRRGLESGRLLTDAPFVVVDTELTGLDEHRDAIVSIGAVRMQGTRIDLADSFSRMVKPSQKLSRKSIAIHGITPSEIEGLPEIENSLVEFRKFCADSVLAGYCVGIDLAFLKKEMRRNRIGMLENSAIDILPLYEWLRLGNADPVFRNLPDVREGGLYRMARAFEIEARGGHNAFTDAYITAQIFQRLIRAAIGHGIRNLGDLMRIADHEGGGERLRQQASMPHF